MRILCVLGVGLTLLVGPALAQSSGDDLTPAEREITAELFKSVGGLEGFGKFRESIYFTLDYESLMSRLDDKELTEDEKKTISAVLVARAPAYVQHARIVADAVSEYGKIAFVALSKVTPRSEAKSRLADAEERRLIQRFGVGDDQVKRLRQNESQLNPDKVERASSEARTLGERAAQETREKGIPSTDTVLRIAAAAVGTIAAVADFAVAAGAITIPVAAVGAGPLFVNSLGFCIGMWGVALGVK